MADNLSLSLSLSLYIYIYIESWEKIQLNFKLELIKV